MAQEVAVTVVGKDRPGIVAGVTRALYELGCNLEDATSTILRGHFSMVLMVTSPDDLEIGVLDARLQQAAVELDLGITVREVEPTQAQLEPPTHMVSVYGSDRPGIVYKVASALVGAGANITDLTSRLVDSEDRPIYALMLEVSAPKGSDLSASLDALKEELGVDVSVHEIDPDVL